MPDAWETAHGLDPDTDDHNAVLVSGYPAIEQYLNELADSLTPCAEPTDPGTDGGLGTDGGNNAGGGSPGGCCDARGRGRSSAPSTWLALGLVGLAVIGGRRRRR